jgi:hypothetical protein
LYCFSGVFGGLQELGLNMYDVRKKCDKAEDKDGPVGRFTSMTGMKLTDSFATRRWDGWNPT